MAVPLALARRRDYAGPALFSYGFRPFFLGAAAWAMSGILLWLPLFFGEITLPIAIGPLDWHIHEMLYGYVAAAMAGFLLTAIPNWTGRLPVCGWPLAALAVLWLAGRVAMLVSAEIGIVAASLIDLSFLIALAVVVVREIVAGKNWRNLRVTAVLAVLIAGNIVWHVEMYQVGAGNYGVRIAISAAIAALMLIGGRIVPSFTHNWLARTKPGRMPRPFSRFDGIAIAGGAIALVVWVIAPHRVATGIALLAAGLLHAVRVARWAGDRTFADRLVLVLHVGYAFVPIGFAMIGASIMWPAAIHGSAGIHAWTAGAIGLMTLAVMTRAALGHTGQPLAASAMTQVIYLLALVAALARIGATFVWPFELLHVAAVAWVAAFAGFLVSYGPLLALRPPAWNARN